MTGEIEVLAALAGVQYFDYQAAALAAAVAQEGPAQRLCLYYKTGSGKSLTALSAVSLWGHDRAVVIAPPSTHPAWSKQAAALGMEVTCMSHAKFRMKGTAMSRHVPVIADEFHMFGGHTGQGWIKLDRLAAGLQAPLVLASATPNYNDAERVYCIKHVLDPVGTRGGFLAFLHQHCITAHNPYSMTPDVTGFLHFDSAAEFLASLPNVEYLPDDLVYTIQDRFYPEVFDPSFEEYGYDARRHRVIASQIEERHTRRYQGLVDEDGSLYSIIYDELADIAGSATTPLLVYANHSSVADAVAVSLEAHRARYGIVTGATSKAQKARTIQRFIDGKFDILVGTASLATGTDGMDKVCHTLVILDDTDDDSLRRQLVGRIMPRGLDSDASMKQVIRFVPQ